MTRSDHPDTTTLSTKLEENFVSPLTAVRGALEILRDYPDIEPARRQRFIESALDECGRLERGVDELAAAVYAAGRQSGSDAPQIALPETAGIYADRIRLDHAAEIADVDFSDFEFSSAKVVNEFFDAIEAVIRPSNRRWYFLTDFRNCSVWPEAWVAFAHRGKKISVNHALGTIRYAEDTSQPPGSKATREDPDMCASREAALARVAEMKTNTPRGA